MFERLAIGLGIALAAIGLMFVGTVGMCYFGYSKACVIDFKPTGTEEIQCQKTPTAKPRKVML